MPPVGVSPDLGHKVTNVDVIRKRLLKGILSILHLQTTPCIDKKYICIRSYRLQQYALGH